MCLAYRGGSNSIAIIIAKFQNIAILIEKYEIIAKNVAKFIKYWKSAIIY